MNPLLKQRIEELILSGEEIKKVFDLSRPTDQYIIERMAYYKYAIPMMTNKGITQLSQNDLNDCLIEMYIELKEKNQILNPE